MLPLVKKQGCHSREDTWVQASALGRCRVPETASGAQPLCCINEEAEAPGGPGNSMGSCFSGLSPHSQPPCSWGEPAAERQHCPELWFSPVSSLMGTRRAEWSTACFVLLDQLRMSLTSLHALCNSNFDYVSMNLGRLQGKCIFICNSNHAVGVNGFPNSMTYYAVVELLFIYLSFTSCKM